MLKTLIIAALASVSISNAVLSQPQTFGKKVKIGRTADIPQNNKWRLAFSDFKAGKEYFGALYVSRSNDEWFYIRGVHSMKNAMSIANKGCEIISKSKCDLYAVSYPDQVNPLNSPAGLSSGASDAFLNKYKAEQDNAKWGAFAIAESGAYGLSYRWVSKAEAQASALANCKAAVADELARGNIEGRKWAKAKGITKCRIIDVFEPTR